ncbi:Cytochrome c [Aliarcobacter thereius]|uniref:Cytochrome c n=2 Tax=Aliarcobacter thereius TaxID=544718 RepID=A0A1C0B9C6_9BACT|nr:c-type cytochrome [Aliarcobacter thereius]OCL88662.1 Cytochrome c [Aliarcobacter thereius]OCL92157.1 Cytochrome c [Aliarcobacter thereius]OCL94747.1 Cytochrome c [Aliarcobacter thereius LMG 24486]OCM00195.1 Cytochrome c [Aliarcobacter thereius]QBF15377.1 ubiquinol cytochrome c oxidoreductase PetABC, membrane-bound cytochrome c subunit [Aliarcobacter thereius LMG 24486]
MRELKILAVVVVLTLVMYWGVEPFAHSQMHPSVSNANFNFAEADSQTSKENVNKLQIALDDANKALVKANDENRSNLEKAVKAAEAELTKAQNFEKTINEFWASNQEAINANGNVSNGEMLVNANCTACHSIESKGFAQVMDNATLSSAYGVTPPDLGSSGKLYTKEFLVAFIKDPILASKVSHKFEDGSAAHPMPGYGWMSSQEIADMVAYLEAIAPKEMTNKEVYVNACQRCHDLQYADMKDKTMLSFTNHDDIARYMGKLPPDLSQHIISRGPDYIGKLVNDPQKLLEGTAMPRVGLNQESQEQVIAYLEEIGDTKKQEREELGPRFIVYAIIFAIIAFLWKGVKWRDIH